MIARTFGERVDAVRWTGADVLAAFGVAATTAGANNALIACPFHEDERPSFSVHLPSGKGHCFGCGAKVGDAVALHRALGRFGRMGDALRDLEERGGRPKSALVLSPSSPRVGSKVAGKRGRPIEVRRWSYRNAADVPVFDVVRLQYRRPDGAFEMDEAKGKPRKEYRPCAPGATRWGMPPGFDAKGSRPLFGLARLLAAPVEAEVFVVEGEPAVDALAGIGVVAVTSSGGAATPDKTDWSPLAGRLVVVWPDNDDAGLRYAAKATELLRALNAPPSLKWIDVVRLELPKGGDAADWVLARSEGTRK